MPQVVGAIRQQRLGGNGGVLDTRARVVLDVLKMWIVRDRDLKRLNVVLLRDGNDDAIRLLDRVRDAALGLVEVDGQGLHARDIDVSILLLLLQIDANLFPCQIVADSGCGDLQTVLGWRQQQNGVAVHARLLRSGGLIQIALGLGTGLARIRRRTGAQDSIVELAVVLNIAWTQRAAYARARQRQKPRT